MGIVSRSCQMNIGKVSKDLKALWDACPDQRDLIGKLAHDIGQGYEKFIFGQDKPKGTLFTDKLQQDM